MLVGSSKGNKKEDEDVIRSFLRKKKIFHVFLFRKQVNVLLAFFIEHPELFKSKASKVEEKTFSIVPKKVTLMKFILT